MNPRIFIGLIFAAFAILAFVIAFENWRSLQEQTVELPQVETPVELEPAEPEVDDSEAFEEEPGAEEPETFGDEGLYDDAP